MHYVSTRGAATRADFETVVLSGLAADGGLYVPASLPSFSAQEIAYWSWLPFDELAWRVMGPFVGPAIPEDAFKALLKDTYSAFAHRSIAPLHQVDRNEWVLELFHGPTRTAKDFAAQLHARLVSWFLDRNQQRAQVLGATNGDTGLAAIEAFGRDGQGRVLVLYPRDGVPLDRLAALQAADPARVLAFAVEGSFDDCQSMVAALFRAWPLPGVHAVGFNSTNWVGVMAQLVLYFHAALQLGGGLRPVGFSIPAASFAEVYAGYIAQKMGLPINQIIISTNRNDALHQFIHSNRYSTRRADPTLSPAMDFSHFANLERFVWELYGHDDQQVKALMESFEASGELGIANQHWLQARMLIDSYAVSDEQTIGEITQLYRDTGYVIDPHTATGVLAARLYRRSMVTPMVTLGEFAPAKSAALLAELGVWPAPEQTPATVGGHQRSIRVGDLDTVIQALGAW
ncbi:threonine synthase [Pseudomonas sp. LFM046]|uniref:threonine synthase n=1 Tax=Pseudomonas sp. LFM046 TaxID=1608357 RepID=UPI0005CFE420|nr:threonine synthase [Pseudomonas sp. LFM046]